MSLIETVELTKRYGGNLFALKDVTLSIQRGEWIAVMGPSGSGKTTLMNIIGCLDRPTSGQVLIDGTDVATLSEIELTRFRRDKVGLVFQQFHLIPYLTAVENVMLAQYYHSTSDEDEAREALVRVGLGDRLTHLPSQLSGGEQQRVCIARALINHPEIILADEPTGNLDEANEDKVMHLFRELHREGHTIIMVTHDHAIGRMADRRVALQHGVLIDLSLSTHETNEVFDEILEQVWLFNEDHIEASEQTLAVPDVVDNRSVLTLMAGLGLIALDLSSTKAPGVRFTPKGEVRAREIIRRHRLAEKLFFEKFEMEEHQAESNACQLEHILSEEVTDSVCAFLGHPNFCPHQKPIPPGQCCTKTNTIN
jgi:putative ABC transport system ATP-binding protein